MSVEQAYVCRNVAAFIIVFLKFVVGLLRVLLDSVRQTKRLSEKLVHQQDMTVDFTQR